MEGERVNAITCNGRCSSYNALKIVQRQLFYGPSCRSSYVSRHPQIRTGGFCCINVSLLACPCCRHLAHSPISDTTLYSSSQRCYLHRLRATHISGPIKVGRKRWKINAGNSLMPLINRRVAGAAAAASWEATGRVCDAVARWAPVRESERESRRRR